MTSLASYVVASYLLGSIPTGYLVARAMGRGSIFDPGENSPKNAGDIFRMLGYPVGIFITVLDVLKGSLAVTALLTYFMGESGALDWRIVSAGAILVISAHCNSPWLAFKGGRGLSTSFGVLLPLLPIPTLMTSVVWACLAFWGLSTRPGAVSAATVLPIFSIVWVWFFDQSKLFYLYVMVFVTLRTWYEYRESLKWYLGLHKIELPPPDMPLNPPTTETPPEPEKK